MRLFISFCQPTVRVFNSCRFLLSKLFISLLNTSIFLLQFHCRIYYKLWIYPSSSVFCASFLYYYQSSLHTKTIHHAFIFLRRNESFENEAFRHLAEAERTQVIVKRMHFLRIFFTAESRKIARASDGTKIHLHRFDYGDVNRRQAVCSAQAYVTYRAPDWASDERMTGKGKGTVIRRKPRHIEWFQYLKQTWHVWMS